MRNIQSCYFCGTPYQLIAAVAIAREEQEPADLYIIDSFNGAMECAQRIASSGIFADVKVINHAKYFCQSRFRLILRCKVLACYFLSNIYSREILIPDTKYCKLYASTRQLSPRIVWLNFIKEKQNVRWICFDDGAGSYFNDKLISVGGYCERMVRRALFGKDALKPSACQLLYSPALYHMLHRDTARDIKRIDSSLNEEKNVILFNNLFDFHQNDLLFESVVLFDCIAKELFSDEGAKRLYAIYQEIFGRFGSENIIVKKHPRDHSGQMENIRYYARPQIPFECVCMNMKCNDKVLVSVSSTAVITPKLLFNQEPCVLLLYKLVKSKRTDFFDENRLYNAVRQLYSDPQRFFIPETLDELINDLNKISALLKIGK